MSYQDADMTDLCNSMTKLYTELQNENRRLKGELVRLRSGEEPQLAPAQTVDLRCDHKTPTNVSNTSASTGAKSMTLSTSQMTSKKASNSLGGKLKLNNPAAEIIHTFSQGRLHFRDATSMRDHAIVIVERQSFEWFMGVIILANSICLGMQSHMSLDGEDMVPFWLVFVEHVFLVLYLAELALHLTAYGRKSFRDTWFVFDFVLVVFGCVSSWIIEPIAVARGSASPLQVILVVRICRLMRLIRALRMLPIFQTAWKLVNGLLTSTNTMLSTLALILVMLFMFACFGIEIIAKSTFTDPVNEHIVHEHFGGLFTAMASLLQFVTLDSVAAIYFPLVMEKPLLVLYFLPILLVLSISLMNLVTAVLVEGALQVAKNDQEVRRVQLQRKAKKELPLFKNLFRDLDRDESGEITIDEIEYLVIGELDPELQDALKKYKVDSITEFFDLIDADGSRRISEQEFIEGFLNLSILDTEQVPTEVMLTLKLMRLSRQSSRDIHESMQQLCKDHALVSELVQQIHQLIRMNGSRLPSPEPLQDNFYV